MPTDFFDQKKVAARVKHQILGAYLGMFTGKTGSTSEGGRVAYVDGFAGPGLYDDASPGSPLLAVDVAELLARKRQLVGYFVEEDKAHADKLRANLAEAGHHDWAVWNTKAEDALPDVLARAGRGPMLVFLDPYGLAVPFEGLVNDVMTRAAKTEVLLHFPHRGLARLAGHLEPQWWLEAQADREAAAARRGGERKVVTLERQRDGVLARLDGFLGGDWWQEYARNRHDGWQREVLLAYIDLVRQRAGEEWGTFVAPVPQRYGGNPLYELVLFTRHPHGLWEFNDATARAYRWLHQQHWQEPDTLFAEGGHPDPRPQYVERIKANVFGALTRGRHGFKVAENSQIFLDESLVGRAGKTEVRQALQQLHEAGVIGGERPLDRRLAYYKVTRGPNAPTGH